MSLYHALVYGVLQTKPLLKTWIKSAGIPAYKTGDKRKYYRPEEELYNQMSAVWVTIAAEEGLAFHSGYEAPQYIGVVLSASGDTPWSWNDVVEAMPDKFSRFALPVDRIEASLKQMASAAAHRAGRRGWKALACRMKETLHIELPPPQLLFVHDWS